MAVGVLSRNTPTANALSLMGLALPKRRLAVLELDRYASGMGVMGSVDVTTTIVIRCPRDRVAAFAANPDNVPKWYDNIQSVEWKTERPVTIGSQIAFVAHFLGQRLAYTYEVVELSDESFVMRTAEGPFPMETTYVWEKLPGDRTRMTLRNRGEPKGFSKLMAPLMRGAMKKANEADLRALKSLFEGSP